MMLTFIVPIWQLVKEGNLGEFFTLIWVLLLVLMLAVLRFAGTISLPMLVLLLLPVSASSSSRSKSKTSLLGAAAFSVGMGTKALLRSSAGVVLARDGGGGGGLLLLSSPFFASVEHDGRAKLMRAFLGSGGASIAVGMISGARRAQLRVMPMQSFSSAITRW